MNAIVDFVRSAIDAAVPSGATPALLDGPNADEIAAHARADVAVARKRLREAMTARETARVALDVARANEARPHGLMAAVEPCELAAKAAEAAAAEFTQRYFERGAPASEPQSDPALADAAEAAARQMSNARRMATGARQALPELSRLTAQAEQALSNAEQNVNQERAAVLIAELAVQVAPVHALIPAFNEAFSQLAAVSQMFERAGLYGLPLRSVPVELIPSVTTQFDSTELYELTRPWADFSRRLASDPEAKFDA